MELKSTLNHKTTNLQKELLLNSKPDFIASTGDNFSGNQWNHKNITFISENYQELVSNYEYLKIPYGITLGNHDTEGGLSANQIMQMEENMKYSVSRNTELNYKYNIPNSNYYVKVYSSSGNKKVAAILWFFDTGSQGCKNNPKSWSCIKEDILNWYEENTNILKKELGYNPQGLAFFHIPVREIIIAYNNNKKIYGGKMRVLPLCPLEETGVVERMLKMKNIKGLFFSHNHGNDFCSKIYGIELCYGRKAGYDLDGPDGKIFKRGARIIDLELIENAENIGYDFTYSHYVLEEGGNEYKYMKKVINKENKFVSYIYNYTSKNEKIPFIKQCEGMAGM